jgi:hypothetical protein
MTEAERRIGLAAEAASELLSVVSRAQKDVLAGLADRPRAGEKSRAREAYVAEMKAIQQFRSVVAGLRDNPVLGSAGVSSEPAKTDASISGNPL